MRLRLLSLCAAVLFGTSACLQAPPQCLDEDGDGFGVGDDRLACAQVEEDCDDGSPDVFPGAEEVCDGMDDDCDGEVDEDPVDGEAWFPDMDGDGFGDGAFPLVACEPPTQYVANGEDCDDSNDTIHPGAFEYNDQVDNDCDGDTDQYRLKQADLKLEGQQEFDSAGYAVAGAGDFNGDGVPDLLVGIVSDDSGSNEAGAVSVVSGVQRGELSLAEAMVKWTGEERDDQVGQVLTGVGDIDGDGFDDLLIGVPEAGVAATSGGKAYLIYGTDYGEQMKLSLESADATLMGGRVGDAVGLAVSGAGDIDGDGLMDFLVGAPGEQAGGVGAGAVYGIVVDVFGDVDLEDHNFCKIVGDSMGSAVGSAVAAGDLDGDGIPDVVVGAPGYGALNRGAAYIVPGPLAGPIPLSGALVYEGEETDSGTGWSVAMLGDVDGDGYADALVGAPAVSDNGAGSGAVYLLLGDADIPAGEYGLSSADAKLLGKSSGDNAGVSVAGVGDVDGDGHADCLVGAPGDDTSGMDGGIAYLVLGPFAGTISLGAADALIVGEAEGDMAGVSVAGVGDVDGDGLPDFMVGAPGQDPMGTDSGAAYLVLGGR